MEDNLKKQITRFLKRKQVVGILGAGFLLTDKQAERLAKVFEVHKTPKNIENMLVSLAIMVKFDLSNYTGRLRRLKGIPGTTEYTQLLRYGREEYIKIYSQQTQRKTKHFKNIVENWTNAGYTKKEAEEEVKIVQTERAKRSALVTTGTSLYSCRSREFWISQGCSQEQAAEKVKTIQTTNGIKYYKEKYPEDYADRFKTRLVQWQQSLSENNEYTELCLKKGHSVKAGLARGLSLEDAEAHYKRIVENLRTIRKKPSKVSQKLFDMVDQRITGTTFYSNKNYEYLIEGYRVDFYHAESKTVVEFYGDYFHRNPKLFSESYSSLGYTSKEKWEYDKAREEKIKGSKKVNNLVIIWESDFRKSPAETTRQLIEATNYDN